MRRRDFVTLIGSAAAILPFAAKAQQPTSIRRIGVLVPYPEHDPAIEPQLTAFRDALGGLGWVSPQTVSFDYRWPGRSNELVQTYAKELVALKPDLILTASVQLVKVLHDETRTIPILFGAASDPVELGLVDSPRTSRRQRYWEFTSMQLDTTVKFLELIKELEPRTAPRYGVDEFAGSVESQPHACDRKRWRIDANCGRLDRFVERA